MRVRPLLATLLLTAGALACRSATAPAPAARVDLAAVLPTDPAYIAGTVVERGRRLGRDLSVLVATDPRDPVADPTETGTGAPTWCSART